MAEKITMPQLSDTMHEGTILSWLKKEGDTVSRGDALAEVATDKADLEIESFHEGVLLKIYAPVGEKVQVGNVIAVIGALGEAVPEGAPSKPAVQESEASKTGNGSHASPSMPASKPATPVATSAVSDRSADERIKISPLARSLAEAHNIDIHTIRGSGEGGRIVKRDVESHLGLTLSSSDRELQNDMGRSAVRGPQSPSRPDRGAAEQFDNWPELRPPQAQSHATQAPVPPVASPRVPQLQTSGQVHGSLVPSVQPQALSRMRETIASRMVESVNSIPHFYVTTKINADALVRMRQSLKSLQEYEGLTFNHLILKAVALALRAVPRVNASYRDGQLVQPQEINVGIVTALEDGLLIPIVKHADYLPLAELVREARGLVQRARAGKPKPDDLVGGTFSISNVGSFAVESFTAIISPGQGGILAVGAIDDEPVVRDGLLTVGKVFRATVSVDHRIIDGVVAATFLTELKRLAEDPVLLLA